MTLPLCCDIEVSIAQFGARSDLDMSREGADCSCKAHHHSQSDINKGLIAPKG